MNYEEFLSEIRKKVEGNKEYPDDWADGKLEECEFEMQDSDSDKSGNEKIRWFTVIITWKSKNLEEENKKDKLFKERMSKAEKLIRKQIYDD